MDLNGSNILNILEKNFGYSKITTCVGPGILMNNYDAFIYSTITGSAYLNNTLVPFSPKGLMKIFSSAFEYNFVTGLFEQGKIKHTPSIINRDYPFVFQGDKIILPLEFNTEIELQVKLIESESRLTANSLSPSDFIIQRVEISKSGNGMEPFLEYLTCEYFKRNGFIVENQVPLAYKVGSPDFAGYILKESFGINDRGHSKNIGFNTFELSMLRLFRTKELKIFQIEESTFIVGEAKTSTSSMAKQINKYMKTGIFTHGYEIHPFKTTSSSTNLGLIRIKSDHLIEIIPAESSTHNTLNPGQIIEYESWLEIYLKLYLLANLNQSEINEFSIQINSNAIRNGLDLIELVSRVTVEKILSIIYKGF